MTDTSRFESTRHLVATLAPEQPIYCLAPTVLQQQVNCFVKGFKGTVGYAVKANPTPEVVRALVDAGINTFDVASLAEIELVRGIAPEATLLYDNPIKSRTEIRRAYEEYKVRSFALDDLIELEKIASIVGDDPSVEFTVRFKIADATAVYDLSKKFGADEGPAIELLKKARDLGYKTALTFHPGSQCTDPASYTNYIVKAAEIVELSGVKISMLNVGGGFPTPYLEAKIPALEAYFEAINSTWDKLFDSSTCTLVCEPGRALIDSAVSILTQIKHRRAEDVVYLNDGVYGGFMEQIFSPIEMPLRFYRGDQELKGKTRPFVAFGPTCDSIDKFGYELPLLENIAEGDWIEFGLQGGYGSSTATQFNGFTSQDYVIVDQGFVYDE